MEMILMEFQHVYERPDLLEEAQANWTQARAVFLHNDTWDVHMYIVIDDDEGGVQVVQIDVDKEDAHTDPDDDEYAHAVWDGSNDEEWYGSFEQAYQAIVGTDIFHGVTPEIIKMVEEAREETKLSRMSKYQRKKYLASR